MKKISAIVNTALYLNDGQQASMNNTVKIK